MKDLRLFSQCPVGTGRLLSGPLEAISEKAQLPQPLLSEQVYLLPSLQFIDLSFFFFFFVIRRPTCFGNPGFKVQEPLKTKPLCLQFPVLGEAFSLPLSRKAAIITSQLLPLFPEML